jgi:hypothetical protein
MRDDILTEYRGREDDIPGTFSLMDDLPGAIESFTVLAERFDTYILSISPWGHPSAWQDLRLGYVGPYLLILGIGKIFRDTGTSKKLHVPYERALFATVANSLTGLDSRSWGFGNDGSQRCIFPRAGH